MIRERTDDDPISVLTALLHRAYASLAEAGLRYVATHQDDDVTRARIDGCECFVALLDGRLVGTITLAPPGHGGGCEWYGRPGVAHFGQLAVEPECQGRGIGDALITHVERRAAEIGAHELALDTACEAARLIETYERRGYRLVGEADWPETNYRSVILSKALST